jgi:hypothetical protein
MPKEKQKLPVDEALDWLEAEEDIDTGQDTWPIEVELDEAETTRNIDLALKEEGDTLDDLAHPTSAPQQVGYRETVSLPEQGIHQLLARFSTDAERSTLYCSIRQAVANQLTLELGQSVVALPTLEDQDTLHVNIIVAIGELRLEGPVQVVATSGTPYLVLGRDLMAGQIVVDPSTAWVKSKR